MLKNQSISILLRSLYFAAAAAVTACSGGASGSALPPDPGVNEGAGGGLTTLSTTASPAVVQSTTGSAFAPASITVSFPTTPVAGHTIIVAFSNNGNTSGGANTYTAPAGWSAVDSNTTHHYHTYEVFSHVVASGESNKYAFTPAYAQREHVFMAAEFSNVAGLDARANAYIAGSTSFTTPKVAPSQLNDLALAFNLPQSSGTWSNPSGWTRVAGPTSVWSGQTLSQNLSTTSSLTEHAVLSTSSTGFAGIVLFKPVQTTTVTATPAPSATSSTTASTPAVLQWKNGSAYAPSALTVSFASTPAAGHVLVVALWNNGQSTGAANTYTPPAGWTLVNQNTAHAYVTYQVFSHVVASGEANSYVFKPLAAQREHIWIAADSNAASVDKAANNFISGSTVFSGPALTPAQSNELALALNLPETGNSVTWSNASGWALGNGPTPVWSGEALDKALSSTSAVSESSTLSAATSGFAAQVLLSPAQSSTLATPAPTAAPTTAPSTAPTTSPTSTPVASGAATYHGCPLFTPNDWFTTNLVAGGSSYVPSTVDSNSANIVTNLRNAFGTINFSANTEAISETANVDPETSGWYMTTVNTYSGGFGFANDPYNDDPSPFKVPVTSGTFYQEGTRGCSTTSGDCHVVVLDTVKCVDYETYTFDRVSWNGSTLTAGEGGVENLNHQYNIEPIAVSGADLPMMGTTDWGEDLSYQKSSCQPNCAIPHVVAFLLPKQGVATGGYVAPADAAQAACSSYCTNKLPYGARLRLHSSYVCPSATTYPQANLICNQLKQYGMIFNDLVGVNGWGGIRLGTSSNGSNPWNSGDYGQLLSKVQITDFDVMTLGTIH